MDNEAELASLKLPLLRCGKICSEFRNIIQKYMAHSNGQHTSFRDWAKLRYMGGTIYDLKTTLTATVASAVIDQYKTMIEEATSDLQEHLQDIKKRLQSFDQHRDPVQDNDDISGQSQNLTNAMLTDFRARVSSNSAALQGRLMELTNRLRQMSEQGIVSKDPTNLNLIKKERKTSDESHQLVVYTIGDLISAKHIITGSKSAQWLGQMSDTSLQQLSRDFRGQVGIGEEPPTQAEKNEFNTWYGPGQLLGEDSPRRRTSPSNKH
ncbi:hypothetical protein AlacWU_00181 [Aspergillus niger]|nr:hypothetical protein AlacWU_00181 [Aspergillus niger]